MPGVTSISADTHKYGYALKGTSTLLYRSKDLRKYQYFTYPDWPGGLYLSPGLAGSRSGGLIASTWAALVTTGRQRSTCDAAASHHGRRRHHPRGVDDIDGIEVIGDPLWLIAFRATDPDIDIYLVNDHLKKLGWRLNSLQLPAALHFCVTRPNTWKASPRRSSRRWRGGGLCPRARRTAGGARGDVRVRRHPVRATRHSTN